MLHLLCLSERRIEIMAGITQEFGVQSHLNINCVWSLPVPPLLGLYDILLRIGSPGRLVLEHTPIHLQPRSIKILERRIPPLLDRRANPQFHHIRTPSIFLICVFCVASQERVHSPTTPYHLTHRTVSENTVVLPIPFDVFHTSRHPYSFPLHDAPFELARTNHPPARSFDADYLLGCIVAPY